MRFILGLGWVYIIRRAPFVVEPGVIKLRRASVLSQLPISRLKVVGEIKIEYCLSHQNDLCHHLRILLVNPMWRLLHLDSQVNGAGPEASTLGIHLQGPVIHVMPLPWSRIRQRSIFALVNSRADPTLAGAMIF